MRLRNWLAVSVSVVLLTAIGTVGIAFNGSALHAADKVHRDDSRALGVNNTTLAAQLQLLSAKELNDMGKAHEFALSPNNAADRAILRRAVAASDFFKYGAAITDLSGDVLTASRTSGLPSADDPGLATLRNQLLAGKPAFSSVLNVGNVMLAAVAVPILSGGQPVAVLVGFTQLATSQLQIYVAKLSAPGDIISVVDTSGTIAASSDKARIGRGVDSPVAQRLTTIPADNFIEFDSGGTDMIAVVVGGLPGGWSYVRVQTKSSFDGVVARRNQSTALTLLAMLLIGVIGVSVLGFRVQQQRRRSEQRFRALFQHAPDVVAVLDSAGHTVYASPSAETLLGAQEYLLVGTSVFDFIHSEDRPRLQAEFAGLLANKEGVLRQQCRVLSSNGTFRWVEFTASNQLHNPSLNGVVINARDVTENRAFQDRLAHEAQHDPLTGLPNRRRMHEALWTLLQDRAVAVLYVDLDGFKPVNDEYGHEAGDDLLRQVAERLIAQMRPDEVVARVGGDEFIVLMPGVVRWFEAESFAKRIRETIEVPFHIGGDPIRMSASIGVHVATPADNPDHVLRAADHAMYAIKKAGGGRTQADLYPRQHPATPASAGRHRPLGTAPIGWTSN